MQSKFTGKTAFVTGASRGIGLAIAKRLAQAGANVIIAAKTADPHPKLEGTIFTAADEIIQAGGKAKAVQCDVRFEVQIAEAIKCAVDEFGGLDILVNNASAISLSRTEATEEKRFKLMHEVNFAGTFFSAKHALPHLRKSANPHILTLSPPLSFMDAKWLAPFLAYAVSKYSMSMVTMGLAAELMSDGIAVNSLWPKTLIATAAVSNLPGGERNILKSRRPEIVADAAFEILGREARQCTGNFFIDEDVLKEVEVTDFSKYALQPGGELEPDIFLD